MANTASNSSLRNQLWDKELFADVQRQIFFMNKELMGESSNSVVQIKNDLKKNQGEKINFGLGTRLTGDGVVGSAELAGNEEKITYYQDDVLIDQVRNAVRLDGELDEQKAAHDLRKDAKEKGSTWVTEFLENQIFMKMGAVNTTTLTRVDGSTVYSGRALWSNTSTVVPTADEVAGYGARYLGKSGTSLASLAATDVLTTTLITRARIKAELASPKIQPLRIDGENFYVMFIHPWQAADLKTAASSVWVAGQQYAAERGQKNPIFTGALGVWDGVILHSHEFVPTAATSAVWATGATACGCRTFRSILCGQQAVLMANASNKGKGAAPTYMREEEFDYGDKTGFAIGYIGGVQKPTFNGLDYGSIIVETGATVLS